jgi:glycopeptide antibiotics resistance protein
MNLFKKILVLLPVLVLGAIYLHDHADGFRHASDKRLAFLGLSLILLYGWFFLDLIRRKQDSFPKMIVQSSFYVYIFMVLTLTGYFILFREVSAHNWWHKMMERIARRDRVNFELFKIFKIYRISDKQIAGNFIMLFPLGIYLPLLYRRAGNFLVVAVICLLVSVVIELLQLVTSFRSADVDDVLLNTMGACSGFIFYSFVRRAYRILFRPGTSLAT